jgi:hypothetical protein
MSATGGAGTSWSSLSIDQMFAMVQGQSRAGYDQLIQGWQQSADVAESHIDYLDDYRSRLAVAWPPSTSEAAQACHGQLEVMIQNMRETWSVALSNRSTLETTAGALDSARADLERILKEYTRNEISLAEHDQQILTIARQYAGRPVATPASPVPAGRQAALEAEARAVMSSLSTDLAVAKSMIRTPPVYKLQETKGGTEDAQPGGSGVGSGAGSSGRAALRLSTLKDQRDAELAKRADATSGGGAGRGHPSPSDETSGPVLVGINPPATGGPSASPPTAPHQSGPLDPHASIPSQTPIGSGRITSPGGTDPFGRSSPPGRTVSGGKPMAGGPLGSFQPTTGIIGGSGPVAGQPMGARPGSSRGTQRVNPVGGILGQTPAPSRSAAGAAGQVLPGTANGRARRSGEQGDERDERRWDPDNPWETDTGVVPVLDSPPETPISPGPAIGLNKS